MTPSKRFYLGMGIFLALSAAAEIALCRALRIHGLGQYAAAWPSAVTLAACAWYTRWRPLPRIMRMPPLMLLALGLWSSLSLWPVLAARASFPLVDTTLAGFDSALGINTASIAGAVHRFPVLNAFSNIVYASTTLLILAALVGPAVARRHEVTERFLVAVVVALLLTTGIFLLYPAVGPWTVETFAPSDLQAATAHFLAAVRSGAPLTLDRHLMGVISFPSFHCVLAVLAARALSSFRPLRWPAWILAALISASTLTTGWHYGVDVLGGLAVAWFATRMAGRLLSAAYAIQPVFASPAASLMTIDSPVDPVAASASVA